ncbi:MAG: S1 RNA-binding domain-containing protein [Candidatus Atribacteria bacterium]|nr:MAG: S1 RNA-binding domain-containing protein [Candidatus Atribacteria bacterium]
MEQRIKMEDAFSESDVKMYSRGDVISGTVVQVNESEILVDIGYKSEGILPVAELSPFRTEGKVEEGEEIEVLVTYIDEEKGTVYASEKQAEYEKRIDYLEEAYRNGDVIEGEITGEVKSAGYHVNLDGIRAFLPGSHLGDDLPSSIEELRAQRIKFKILELSRRDKNLVVSHKVFVKEQEKEKRMALFQSLEKDQEIEGTIRSVVDFGLFVDIGGFEGLVHRSEIAWKDLPVPPPDYRVGEKVNVKVLDFDTEKGKVSLSIKRLRSNPWDGIMERFIAGTEVTGTVVSVTDFGAFVELEQDVEGLVHVSELSWGHPESPKDIVSEGDKVTVVVLSVDEAAHRISLSLRRTQSDPWGDVTSKYPRGQVVSGTVTKLTDFGAFVKLENGIEGLVHVSEIDWGHVNHPRDVLSEGEVVEVKVLSADPSERRISLSIRELKDNPWKKFVERFAIDEVVEGTITEIKDFGAFMKITDDVDGLIHVSEISDERIATPADVLAVGAKIQARIIGINEDKRQVRLTMRNLFGPPEIPAAAFEERDRERATAGRSGSGSVSGGKGRAGGRGKERGGRSTKERVDRRFLDDAGHESLSMRDLLAEATSDEHE